MIDVNKYITDLLYEHDCVILPGFGALILNIREGKYDAGNRQFSPPCRQVSFNGLLKDDDGLLISYISEKEGSPYGQAKKFVVDYVERLRKRVEQDGQVQVDGVGKFTLSTEGKWVFTRSGDINYLDRSFGLQPVIVQPAHKEIPAHRHRALKERKDRRPVAATPVPKTVKWTVITAIPVILFLLWGILFPASFQQRYTSYSGIITDLFILDESPVTDQPHTITASDPVNTHEKDVPSPVENRPETKTEQAPLKEDVSLTQNPVPEKDTKEVPVEHNIKYHVIGGVFRSEENASRYVEALAQLGYNSAMAGTSNKGFFRVSYDRFPTWDQAASFLETIRKKENPSAWILKF
jgi:nucleoid DNA-binding protein